MKFKAFSRSISEIMEIMIEDGIKFDDTFVYLKHGDKLYTTSKIEFKYSEPIDKYVFIIHLDDD